eukprot:SAG11_NODE_2167_length_3725_cov_4.938224_1_plen_232_part_10
MELISEHGRHHNGGGTPLFLYLALHNIHGPDEVAPEFLARYDPEIWAARRTLDAMVSAVDSTLANVSAALARAGMAEDTLTIVVSDNGGPIQEPGGSWSPGNNFPSRGGKYSFFEGGIKVVGMLTWPRMLKKHPRRMGSVWDGMMSVADWWPVLCGLAGVDPDDSGPGRWVGVLPRACICDSSVFYHTLCRTALRCCTALCDSSVFYHTLCRTALRCCTALCDSSVFYHTLC